MVLPFRLVPITGLMNRFGLGTTGVALPLLPVLAKRRRDWCGVHALHRLT